MLKRRSRSGSGSGGTGMPKSSCSQFFSFSSVGTVVQVLVVRDELRDEGCVGRCRRDSNLEEIWSDIFQMEQRMQKPQHTLQGTVSERRFWISEMMACLAWHLPCWSVSAMFCFCWRLKAEALALRAVIR